MKHLITLAANVRKTIPGGGNSLVIRTALYPVTVRFYKGARELAGDRADDVNDYAVNLFAPDGSSLAFTHATIESSVAQTVEVYTSEGHVTNAGSPQSASNTFFAGAGHTAVAGEYTHAEFWNPADSGVICAIDEINISVDAAQDVYIRHRAAQLSGTSAGWANKELGGTAGKLLVGTYQNAALQGTLVGRFYVEPGAVYRLSLPAPFKLIPGRSLLIASGATQQQVWTFVQGRQI